MRNRSRWNAILLVPVLASCTGVASAFAGAGPNIDGNGADLIAFAAAIGQNGIAVDHADNRDDIVIDDPKIVVCGTKVDTDGNGTLDYFVNGFDLRRFVFVYDRSAQSAYVLWRQEGIVGDVEGNNHPDHSVCPIFPSFPDQPGIGSQENYQVRIDTDGNGTPEITISVGGGQNQDAVSVAGASFSGSSVDYRPGVAAGHDLELAIFGLSLPNTFRLTAHSNAPFDGMTEDTTPVLELGAVPATPATWGGIKSGYR